MNCVGSSFVWVQRLFTTNLWLDWMVRLEFQIDIHDWEMSSDYSAWKTMPRWENLCVVFFVKYYLKVYIFLSDCQHIRQNFWRIISADWYDCNFCFFQQMEPIFHTSFMPLANVTRFLQKNESLAQIGLNVPHIYPPWDFF